MSGDLKQLHGSPLALASLRDCLGRVFFFFWQTGHNKSLRWDLDVLSKSGCIAEHSLGC